MKQNSDLDLDSKADIQKQAEHRLSALHLLGIRPLVAYKNITSNFELEIPEFIGKNSPSATQVLHNLKAKEKAEKEREEREEQKKEHQQQYVNKADKPALSASHILADAQAKSLDTKNRVSATQVLSSNSSSKTQMQSLFQDLENTQAQKAAVKKASLREPQVYGENLNTSPKLDLRIWTLANKWVFISDDNFSNSLEFANAEKLLRNILLALRLDLFFTASYEFKLPQPDVFLEDMTWEDLARSLSIYLKGARFESLQPLAGVILFSDNNLQQIRANLAQDFNIYLGAPSLHKLLRDPVQKQLFWQKILNENWHKKLNRSQEFYEEKNSTSDIG